MQSMGFLEHIILILKSKYDEQKASVRATYGLTEWFDIDQKCSTGVHFVTIPL